MLIFLWNIPPKCACKYLKKNSLTAFQYFHCFDYVLFNKVGAFRILKRKLDRVSKWIWFKAVQSWLSIVKYFKEWKKQQQVLTLFRVRCIRYILYYIASAPNFTVLYIFYWQQATNLYKWRMRLLTLKFLMIQ